MTKAVASSSAKDPRARSRAAGYPKGDEVRERILRVALIAFGENGFRATTTRQIAEGAGVNLPALQYYFGGKQGLYLACAEDVVDHYLRHMAGATRPAAIILEAEAPRQVAIAELKAVVRALATFLVGSQVAPIWAPFVSREVSDPGPAFEILYTRLWQPGVALMAGLVGKISGEGPKSPTSRVQALLIISSLMAFQSGRRVSQRLLDWPQVGEAELSVVIAVLEAQIDAIGRVRGSQSPDVLSA